MLIIPHLKKCVLTFKEHFFKKKKGYELEELRLTQSSHFAINKTEMLLVGKVTELK